MQVVIKKAKTPAKPISVKPKPISVKVKAKPAKKRDYAREYADSWRM